MHTQSHLHIFPHLLLCLSLTPLCTHIQTTSINDTLENAKKKEEDEKKSSKEDDEKSDFEYFTSGKLFIMHIHTHRGALREMKIEGW